jgi:hypothetical protein
MKTVATMFLGLAVALALPGCGDGSVEIKTKSNPPTVVEKNTTVIERPTVVERPVIIEKSGPTKEVIKTETRKPDGSSVKTETKTTTP